MTLMDFSIFPVDKGASLSGYVARCVALVDASGLDYQLHPMGTVVEGQLPELLALLQACFAELRRDCDRVSCSAKFDDRAGDASRLQAKVASVQAKVDRELRTWQAGS